MQAHKQHLTTHNQSHDAPVLSAPIRSYLIAYNAFDIAGVEKVVAPGIVFRNMAQGEVTTSAEGKDAFMRLASEACALFSERRQVVREAITVSDTTLITVDYTATVARDLPNGWRAGERVALRGRSLFQIADGLIVRLIDEGDGEDDAQ